MGFFKKIGRQVEQFKQTAKAEESTDYQCQDCDSRFPTDHDQCPECGGETISSTAED